VYNATNDSWRPVLAGELAADAVRAARDVADRLRDPAQVEAAAALARTQTRFPRSSDWAPYSTAQGYAGLCLLWGYLDVCFPGEGWDLVGRQHLELAVRGAEAVAPLSVGLFGGVSGLAFGAQQLSRAGTRYQRLLASLDATIAAETIRLAEALDDSRDGIAFSDFDVIAGLSGVGTYLLCRAPSPALSRVTQAMIDLTAVRNGVPRWHTPVQLQWDEGMQQTYPHGSLNCGLAHGVPGLIAFLSLAMVSGDSRPGLSEALTRAADWLGANRFDDAWGINWPTAVPLERVEDTPGTGLSSGSPLSSPGGPSRCAWCYGSPGIARALWLAGEALHRDDLRQLAIRAITDVFQRPIPARRIDSATFCHGAAGLLAITLRFANDTASEVLAAHSRTLVCQLLQHYQPESLLGFRNLETSGSEIDQPGLLDGAPGVALTLLAAATDREPTWDRLFLLS
jgi:hypothetical protein